MHGLLETLVSNGAVALALALLAVLATGLRARPALVHGLWVLVLLKLVTPPIIRVPISLPEPAPPTASSAAQTFPSAPPLLPASGPTQPLAPSPSSPVPTPPAPGFEVPWLELLLSLWALGSALTLVSTARDLRRMKGLIRSGHLAPPELQRQVEDLAQRLGLKRAPQATYSVNFASQPEAKAIRILDRKRNPVPIIVRKADKKAVPKSTLAVDFILQQLPKKL